MTSSFTVASETIDVADEYRSLTMVFESAYLSGEYSKARDAVLLQLDMDPSDSLAFLRLALSIDDSCHEVKPYYSQYGSDVPEGITHIAKMIINKKCGIILK